MRLFLATKLQWNVWSNRRLSNTALFRKIGWWLLVSIPLAIVLILTNLNKAMQVPINTCVACFTIFFIRSYNLKHHRTFFLKYEFLVLLPYVLIITGPLIIALLSDTNILTPVNYLFTLLAGILGYNLATRSISQTRKVAIMLAFIIPVSLLGSLVIAPYLPFVANDIMKPYAEKRIYKLPIKMCTYTGDTLDPLKNTNEQYYIFEVWHQRCGPCWEEIELLAAHLDKIEKLPLHIYLVNSFDSIIKPNKSLKQIMTSKKVTLLKDYKRYFSDSLKTESVPKTYIFDKQGMLIDDGHFSWGKIALNYNIFNRLKF